MDGGESSGGGIAPEDSIINRIMLRFRPIAPKPAAGGAGNGGPEETNNKNGYVCVGRRKRKYVRVSAGKSNNSNRRKEIESVSNSSMEGMKKEGNTGFRSHNNENKTQSLMIPAVPAKNHLGFGIRDLGPLDMTNQPPEKLTTVMAESRVTVLSLVDACMEDESGLGCTDDDKWRNLEADTFPGFISDADSSVVWSNAAYRKMVSGGEEGAAVQMTVTLVVKDCLPLFPASAFSCMVRVQYTWQTKDKRKRGKTLVVPCDVWRMGNGGFAWRLDLKASLSLGTLS